MHDIGLRELYQTKSKSDPMAFFVGNEVYDHLEKVVDRFDDVANVMHGIVIEHVQRFGAGMMDVALSLPVLLGLIAVALVFDFLNGLHDAANSIATIVSTRVLRPQYAVGWAAFSNFIAFLFFVLHVANTLGTGIIAAAVVDARVVFGALWGPSCGI